MFPWRFVMYVLGKLNGVEEVCGLDQREIAVYYRDHKEQPVRNAIFDLIEEIPRRQYVWTLHFGPVYPPSVRYLSRQQQREMLNKDVFACWSELVLDADINDFPDRKCCNSSTFCDTCWHECMQKRVVEAVERVMIAKFKMTHIFYVFSGRRGIHIWCMDPAVIQWDHYKRAQFMTVMNRTCPDAKFDTKVTTERSHMHKVPLGLHGETGNFCNAIADPKTFLPSRDAIHWSNLTQQHVLQSVEIIKKALQ
jgi:hypothetical protein